MRFLELVNKERVQDLNKEDIRVLIHHEILPIMSSNEKDELLENNVVFSLRGGFNNSTVVEFIEDDEIYLIEGAKLLDSLDEKYKTKFFY